MQRAVKDLQFFGVSNKFGELACAETPAAADFVSGQFPALNHDPYGFSRQVQQFSGLTRNEQAWRIVEPAIFHRITPSIRRAYITRITTVATTMTPYTTRTSRGGFMSKLERL